MRQLDPQIIPRFGGISTFARLPISTELDDVKAAFVGIPFDDATTFRPGARFGPSGIRQGSRLLRPYNPFVDVYPSIRSIHVISAISKPSPDIQRIQLQASKRQSEK